jgi:putative two-component system hydrogenase maturation factor HypX/HoxX
MRLLDAAFGADLDEFRACTVRLAERVAHDGLHRARLQDKRRRRRLDEQAKPLREYRQEELARCDECFFGSDKAYHEARRRFVYKVGAAGAGIPVPVAAACEPGNGPLAARASVEQSPLAGLARDIPASSACAA